MRCDAGVTTTKGNISTFEIVALARDWVGAKIYTFCAKNYSYKLIHIGATKVAG